MNSLGQRTSVGPIRRAQNNTPVSTHSVEWGWEYDGLGQIQNADFGDDDQTDAEERFYESFQKFLRSWRGKFSLPA